MKRIITLLLALVTLFSVSVSAFAVSVEDFTDVSSTDWFYNDVAYAVKHGIVNGTSATTFSPYDTITRGQFITALGRWFGDGNIDNLNIENTGKFKDVPANEYYTKYVCWADTSGIITGASTDSFYPNASITREDAAAMLYNYALAWGEIHIFHVENENPQAFSDDAQIAGYAKDGVKFLQTINVVKGDDTGKFNPKNSMKRAEYVALFSRYMQTFEKYNGGNGGEGVETPEPETYDWTSAEYVERMNAEFERLLNEARAAEGKAPIEYRPEYQYGVDIRAKEFADKCVTYGNGLNEDIAHSRPNGDGFTTVYDDNPELKNKVGCECLFALTGLKSYHIVERTPEMAAKKAFDGWMNSSGHRSILMSSKGVDGFACGIYYNETDGVATWTYIDSWSLL